jgi:hypothetical protein
MPPWQPACQPEPPWRVGIGSGTSSVGPAVWGQQCGAREWVRYHAVQACPGESLHNTGGCDVTSHHHLDVLHDPHLITLVERHHVNVGELHGRF